MANSFNWDEHPIVSNDSTAKSFSWDDHPVVDGTKDNPVESNLFNDKDRTKASFGDTGGVGKMLIGKGFVDFAKNKDGDLVAKDSNGVWHRDANRFFSGNPINWAESGVGKALPLAGGIAAGLSGIVSGPGAIAAAAAGGAGGEAARIGIGKGMGVYDGGVGDAALDMGKEGLGMAAGEGIGRYVVPGVARSFMNSGIKDVAQAGMDKAGGVLAKAGSTMTGVPEQEIKTYAKHGPEIDQAYKAADGNYQDMADDFKAGINNKVSQYKKGLNEQIGQALETAPKDPIEITPVLDKLKALRDKMNPDLNPEGVKDIQTLIDRIEKTSDIKKNSVIGYDAPGEKNVTISNSIAAGGPQKRFLLHEPGEPFVPQDQGEVISDLPGQQGQRTVPVIDTTPSVLGEQGMPSEGAQDILGNKTISRAGVNRTAEEMLGNPDFGGVSSIVDSGNSPKDGLVELPVQGRPTYYGPLTKLHEVTKFLQDQAAPAYGSTPLGFKVGDAGANAARDAAKVSRGILEDSTASMPNAQSISDANAGLSRLHGVEDTMNRNLLAEGKTGSPLFAAGSGNNLQSANSLRDLGAEIGSDVLGDAHKLAAARTFGDAPWLPIDSTGKSRTRTAIASGIGGIGGMLFGGVNPMAAAVGGAAGNALASPAMLKMTINGGRAMGNMAQSPLVQAVIKNPALLRSIENPALRQAVSAAASASGVDDLYSDDEKHYDPSGEKAQPTENAKQKFLEGN